MKTVMKIVLAGVILMVLAVGGCMALIGGAANEIDKEIKAEEKHDTPTPVQVGKPFEHDGYRFTGAWTVRDDFGSATIEGLKATNARKERAVIQLTFTFVRGQERLAEVECNAGELEPGQSAAMDCFSADKLPAKPYEVRVADMW